MRENAYFWRDWLDRQTGDRERAVDRTEAEMCGVWIVQQRDMTALRQTSGTTSILEAVQAPPAPRTNDPFPHAAQGLDLVAGRLAASDTGKGREVDPIVGRGTAEAATGEAAEAEACPATAEVGGTTTETVIGTERDADEMTDREMMTLFTLTPQHAVGMDPAPQVEVAMADEAAEEVAEVLLQTRQQGPRTEKPLRKRL